ncbi:hypothetical protein BgiMline_033838, partial [Biomphalaria glabrata]
PAEKGGGLRIGLATLPCRKTTRNRNTKQQINRSHEPGRRLTSSWKAYDASRLKDTSNFVVGGTIFPDNRIHKAMWISPDLPTEN